VIFLQSFNNVSFAALTLVSGWQEVWHPACRNLCQLPTKVLFKTSGGQETNPE